MERERQQPDQQRGEPEPEQEHAGRQQFQRHQDDAEDQPVPGPEGGEHFSHDGPYPDKPGGGTGGTALVPALGTEERRAAACAEAALSPNVALAISPMPASDPRMLIASIGSMMIFWFGESASCPNALMYLSAMK